MLHLFTPRCYTHSVDYVIERYLSVCLSVCLSVTIRYQNGLTYRGNSFTPCCHTSFALSSALSWIGIVEWIV